MFRLPTPLAHQIAGSKRSFRFVFFGAPLLGAFACGGGGGGDATVTAPVVPAAPTIASVSVTLPVAKLEVGSTTTATASVLDKNGAPITGKSVTWSSDNSAVATVSSEGVVTATGAGAAGLGTANILATVDGIQGKSTTTVTSWVYDGMVFTNGDFPGSPGGFADVGVVRLTDGRFRMFIGASPAGAVIISAISSDGVKFALESGNRVTCPLHIDNSVGCTDHRPFVFRLEDGRLRMFESVIGGTCTASFGCPTPLEAGFYSLTSADEGLTWKEDSGVRLTRAATGLGSLQTGAIVKTKTGGWRFYFADNAPTINGVLGFPQIRSAFSTDLVTWTMDPGVRIGTGAALSGTGQSPAAVANADGSITLIYFRNRPGLTMQSTSADGLNFTSETQTGFGFGGRLLNNWGADTNALILPNGDVRLYFNFGNETSGTIYTAHHVAFSLN